MLAIPPLPLGELRLNINPLAPQGGKLQLRLLYTRALCYGTLVYAKRGDNTYINTKKESSLRKLFLKLGSLIFFNKHRQSVRHSIVFLLTNFLLIAVIVFTIEIILIFCGVGNIFVPMTQKAWQFLTRLVF
jgi:hypothetical protein